MENFGGRKIFASAGVFYFDIIRGNTSAFIAWRNRWTGENKERIFEFNIS